MDKEKIKELLTAFDGHVNAMGEIIRELNEIVGAKNEIDKMFLGSTCIHVRKYFDVIINCLGLPSESVKVSEDEDAKMYSSMWRGVKLVRIEWKDETNRE